MSLFGALMSLRGSFRARSYAAEIIIFREVPTHNALEPLPPGYGNTVAVPTEEADLILSLVPGPKMLTTEILVLCWPLPRRVAVRGRRACRPRSSVIRSIGPSGGQPLSNLPGSGMGSFSSLGGLGGQISGQVGGTIHNAMQGLSGALGCRRAVRIGDYETCVVLTPILSELPSQRFCSPQRPAVAQSSDTVTIAARRRHASGRIAVNAAAGTLNQQANAAVISESENALS